MQALFVQVASFQFGQARDRSRERINSLQSYGGAGATKPDAKLAHRLGTEFLGQLSRTPVSLGIENIQQLTTMILTVWNFQIFKKLNLYIEVAQLPGFLPKA